MAVAELGRDHRSVRGIGTIGDFGRMVLVGVGSYVCGPGVARPVPLHRSHDENVPLDERLKRSCDCRGELKYCDVSDVALSKLWLESERRSVLVDDDGRSDVEEAFRSNFCSEATDTKDLDEEDPFIAPVTPARRRRTFVETTVVFFFGQHVTNVRREKFCFSENPSSWGPSLDVNESG